MEFPVHHSTSVIANQIYLFNFCFSVCRLDKKLVHLLFAQQQSHPITTNPHLNLQGLGTDPELTRITGNSMINFESQFVNNIYL